MERVVQSKRRRTGTRTGANRPIPVLRRETRPALPLQDGQHDRRPVDARDYVIRVRLLVPKSAAAELRPARLLQVGKRQRSLSPRLGQLSFVDRFHSGLDGPAVEGVGQDPSRHLPQGLQSLPTESH